MKNLILYFVLVIGFGAMASCEGKVLEFYLSEQSESKAKEFFALKHFTPCDNCGASYFYPSASIDTKDCSDRNINENKAEYKKMVVSKYVNIYLAEYEYVPRCSTLPRKGLKREKAAMASAIAKKEALDLLK